ncbi:sensor histidine kinase [uncultured Paraglaciecola sp.]|uniref:sensor histidine kinase n=1 Tax=uncultured Paraglaciecola sp. TaxID=1765024 RepID=UPI002605DAF2|nr:histidine kinase [uncultured Paraglaciecola sp.]
MPKWEKLVDSRERLFWTLHTAGWCGFAIVYWIGSFMHEMRSIWLFVIILNAYAGWLLTIPLRYIYRKALTLSPLKMLLLVAISLYVIALLWAMVKNVNHWEIYKKGFRPDEWYWYFRGTINSLIMIGCWTGAYFGVKNYQMLLKEKQNVLKASSMAHQAHIKMLRYQLNPHFLFNTLNAISTLVLMKENKTAEAMVSRLSDFLRYSLDKDPIQRIPLIQEIQALELYLEIEKVRFEDRLTVVWDIEEETKDALVPSLILQPIIENSIKFAISKMQEGGQISISAKTFGRDLMLNVSDNGPGADIKNGQLPISKGSGVGLHNIQERLAALYVKNYSFVISHNYPAGIKINIRIPFEKGDGSSDNTTEN